MSSRREALLRAHVQFELARLCGPSSKGGITSGTAKAFEWFQTITLDELVTSEQIIGVIDRYVIRLQVSGGITELAGQMAQAVFSSHAAEVSRVREIFTPSDYEQFATKIQGLTFVQEEIVRYLARSPSFVALVSRVVSHLGAALLFARDERDGGSLSGRVLGAGQRLFPGLEQLFTEALARYVERHAPRLGRVGAEPIVEALDPEWVRQAADELWEMLADKPLAEVLSLLDSQDLEDFIVLGYEFWLRFRRTPYFKAVSSEVVERLFEKYGNESVFSVIEDMGVTEEMLARELRGFLPTLLEVARRTGFLERVLRRRLAAFYESPAAREILDADPSAERV